MSNMIRDLIKGGEGVTTEFKRCKNELPRSVFESIGAFLNRNGGYILLGVEDDGAISGIDESAILKIKKELVSALNNPNRISPTVYLSIETVELSGKTILSVFVPESSQVHKVSGRIYDRNEDGDFDITDSTDQIATIYTRKQREYTENTIYQFATTDDLKTELIDRVRQMAVNRTPHHPWENLSNAGLLKSAGLYQRNMQTENANRAHGYGKIDIEDFTPYPKNPVIAGVFKEIGWADELGSGIRNIKKYAKIYSNSEPEFVEKDVFKTIIQLKEDRVTDKKPAIKTGDRKCALIIGFLKERDSAKASEISEYIGNGSSMTREYLNRLVENGTIIAEGTNKYRVYRLKK